MNLLQIILLSVVQAAYWSWWGNSKNKQPKQVEQQVQYKAEEDWTMLGENMGEEGSHSSINLAESMLIVPVNEGKPSAEQAETEAPEKLAESGTEEEHSDTDMKAETKQEPAAHIKEKQAETEMKKEPSEMAECAKDETGESEQPNNEQAQVEMTIEERVEIMINPEQTKESPPTEPLTSPQINEEDESSGDSIETGDPLEKEKEEAKLNPSDTNTSSTLIKIPFEQELDLKLKQATIDLAISSTEQPDESDQIIIAEAELCRSKSSESSEGNVKEKEKPNTEEEQDEQPSLGQDQVSVPNYRETQQLSSSSSSTLKPRSRSNSSSTYPVAPINTGFEPFNSVRARKPIGEEASSNDSTVIDSEEASCLGGCDINLLAAFSRLALTIRRAMTPNTPMNSPLQPPDDCSNSSTHN